LPDGRFLAVSDRGADGQSWGVYLISVETGEKRALTTTGNPRIIDRLPAFSPDGRTLAFFRGSFAPTAELFSPAPHRRRDTGGSGEGRRGGRRRRDQ